MENQDIPQATSVSELVCLITLFNETQSSLHLLLPRLETMDISVERKEDCGFIISQFEKKKIVMFFMHFIIPNLNGECTTRTKNERSRAENSCCSSQSSLQCFFFSFFSVPRVGHIPTFRGFDKIHSIC